MVLLTAHPTPIYLLTPGPSIRVPHATLVLEKTYDERSQLRRPIARPAAGHDTLDLFDLLGSAGNKFSYPSSVTRITSSIMMAMFDFRTYVFGSTVNTIPGSSGTP